MTNSEIARAYSFSDFTVRKTVQALNLNAPLVKRGANLCMDFDADQVSLIVRTIKEHKEQKVPKVQKKTKFSREEYIRLMKPLHPLVKDENFLIPSYFPDIRIDSDE